MKPTFSKTLGRVALLGLVSILVLAGQWSVRAQIEAPLAYTLDWWTADGSGGQPGTGGVYSLDSTAGQPDAGASSGGAYVLEGGYWAGASAPATTSTPTPTPTATATSTHTPTPTLTPTATGTVTPMPYAVFLPFAARNMVP